MQGIAGLYDAVIHPWAFHAAEVLHLLRNGFACSQRLSHLLLTLVCDVQVITALLASSGLLLIRTVFGLLSIDHPKFSNRPQLLYTLVVLPELLALYIVAFLGFMPAVGRNADLQQHKPVVLPIARTAAQPHHEPV